MNVPLLLQLREAGGEYVPHAMLGGDVEATRRDLDDLEAFGFALERHPVRGVAYLGHSPRLCPDLIEWELDTRYVGRRVAVWDRVGSTNDVAARASGSRNNEGLVVLAEEQNAGRGSRGRSWTAPPGSAILMSVLLFPPPELSDPAWLTALGAVAVARVAEEAIGRAARIKWPNDVRIGGRKVAGILVERGRGLVVGIGLNVNAGREDFPEALRDSATSLRLEAGGPMDRSAVARSLIRELDRLYDAGLQAGPTPLGAAWGELLEAPSLEKPADALAEP